MMQKLPNLFVVCYIQSCPSPNLLKTTPNIIFIEIQSYKTDTHIKLFLFCFFFEIYICFHFLGKAEPEVIYCESHFTGGFI